MKCQQYDRQVFAHRKRIDFLRILLFALGLFVAHAGVCAPATELVSVAPTGGACPGGSSQPVLSATGRYLVFVSPEERLNPGAHAEKTDVYFRDRQTGRTRCVSVSSAGVTGNRASRSPAMSADGRLVAFASHADNLVPGDNNGVSDIFVHDNQSGETYCVSVTADGVPANGASTDPSISADGHFVAFVSNATNLTADKTHGMATVYLRDLRAGTTRMIGPGSEPSLSGDGRYLAFVLNPRVLSEKVVALYDARTRSINAIGPGEHPSLSADGQVMAFQSTDSSLTPDKHGDEAEIFLCRCATTEITRVTMTSDGAEPNGTSGSPLISANGRYILFKSAATNLRSDADNTPAAPNTLCWCCYDSVDGITQYLADANAILLPGDTSPAAMNANGHLLAYPSREFTDATAATRAANIVLLTRANRADAGQATNCQVRHGVAFTQLRTLAAWLGARIDINGAEISLVTGWHSITFQADQAAAFCDGQEMRLKDPPMEIAGELYIPTQLVQDGLGVQVCWDEKANQLTFTAQEGADPLVLAAMLPPVVIAATHHYGRAKFEPKHGCYLGAFIDFDPTLKRSICRSGRAEA